VLVHLGIGFRLRLALRALHFALFRRLGLFDSLSLCRIAFFPFHIHIGLGNSAGQEAAMYDMKNLAKLKNLEAHAPEATKPFWAFDKAAWTEGAIPRKYKELIAIAVALTIQCHEGNVNDILDSVRKTGKVSRIDA